MSPTKQSPPGDTEEVDDFCQTYLCQWYEQQLAYGNRKRRHVKGYYNFHVRRHLQDAFPGLVSYAQFCRTDALGIDAAMCLSQPA